MNKDDIEKLIDEAYYAANCYVSGDFREAVRAAIVGALKAQRERDAAYCATYGARHHDIRRAALEVCADHLRSNPLVE